MNDSKELNEILNEPSADEALKSIAEILESENFNDGNNIFTNEAYIENADFRLKCNELTPNPILNEAMYVYAKEALKRRSGTLYEDIYLFDSRTGKVIAKQTDGIEIRKVTVIPETLKACGAYNSDNITSFHTHPSSMPPSVTDFNTVYRLGWGKNFIFGHNGRIFGYTSREEIDQKLFDFCVSEYIGVGFSSFSAHILAIKEFMADHDIKFWEVKRYEQ